MTELDAVIEGMRMDFRRRGRVGPRRVPGGPGWLALVTDGEVKQTPGGYVVPNARIVRTRTREQAKRAAHGTATIGSRPWPVVITL